MPANTKHPRYSQLTDVWARMRDCAEGEDAVKRRGTVYLPSLSGNVDKEYADYKLRAMFYSATGRTVEGLQGAIFRKPAKVEWPESEKDRLKSIGSSGETFEVMASASVRDLLTTGRFGLLVDAPDKETNDGEAYVTMYCAENIINWRTAVVNGKRVVTMVVLAETYEVVDPKDPYAVEVKPQWRVLHLGNGPAYDTTGKRPRIAAGFGESDLSKPFYYQELWRENPDKTAKDKLVLISTVTPRKSGGRLWDKIPFAFANPANNEADPMDPPLRDLANVNLSHYRSSADLEHGRHYTALPTAWFAGFTFDGEVQIGSAVAYSTDNDNAKAGFLEFTGSGLGALATALEQKERLMATLGSRLLEQQKTGVETAQAIVLRSTGEQSALTLIAKSASAAWTMALQWLSVWNKTTDDGADKITVALNTEFTSTTLDSATLSSMIQAAQSGLMSWETFFYNLQRGGVVPEGTTADEERERIENEGLPAALGLAMSGLPTDPNDPKAQDKGADGEEDPADDGEEDPEADPKDPKAGKAPPKGAK